MYGWNWIRMNGFLNLSVNIPLTCLFRVFLTKLFKPSFPTGNGSTSMNKQQLIQFPFQNSSSSIQTLNSISNKSLHKILSWKGSYSTQIALFPVITILKVSDCCYYDPLHFLVVIHLLALLIFNSNTSFHGFPIIFVLSC